MFLFAQSADLKFTEISNNGTNYIIKVWIKGSSVFKLGTSNITFNFNNSALSSPVLDSAFNFTGGLYNQLTITNPLPGVCSINIELFVINNGQYVDTTWKEIASIKFNTIDPSGYSELNFRTVAPNMTNIWNDDNASIIQAGNFASFNTLLPINDESNHLENFSLANNYPNPFNPSTIIEYTIPNEGYVLIKIFDVLGNQVETIVSEIKPSGKHSAKFTPSKNISNGIYFYRLEVGNSSITKKMNYLK